VASLQNCTSSGDVGSSGTGDGTGVINSESEDSLLSFSGISVITRGPRFPFAGLIGRNPLLDTCVVSRSRTSSNFQGITPRARADIPVKQPQGIV
jgi:hypothetical protein